MSTELEKEIRLSKSIIRPIAKIKTATPRTLNAIMLLSKLENIKPKDASLYFLRFK